MYRDLYSTALEICYMIATQILKIDLEIAEYWGQSWQRENDKKQIGLKIMDTL